MTEWYAQGTKTVWFSRLANKWDDDGMVRVISKGPEIYS